MNTNFNIKLLDFLECPQSGQRLLFEKKKNILKTIDRQYSYKIIEGIPLLSVHD